MPSECSATEVRCDSGTYDGCWIGDYCMPEDYICPHVCDYPAPAQCGEGEIVCDMGSHAGCWMGDYCMPGGSDCPPVCNSPAPSVCGAGDLSVTWDSTMDAGWETTACLQGLSVPRCVTSTLQLSVLKERLSVTWWWMIAGLATTACLQDPNALNGINFF